MMLRAVSFALVFLVMLVVEGSAGGDGVQRGGETELTRSAPAAPGSTELQDSYVESLLRQADERELHRHPYWHTLVHYKRGLLGRRRSLVDDDRFFASPDGKKDPRSELHATLRSFFEPAPREVPAADSLTAATIPNPPGAAMIPDSLTTANIPDTLWSEHGVCRFPARFAWLRDELGIDPARMPVTECPTFEDFYAAIDPQSASLIFPTAYMNSPASMFGHTLLTIEGASGSELLSYAVNYAAVTNETFGPFYMVKGLLGLYPGYFSILPYYAKLQQYSDVNDRDIWEYPLNLDRSEIRRLLAHVYELEDIYADYKFFTENCSYDLLFLLDAARPSLNLTDQFGGWVLPVDTVRKVKSNGLVSDVVYRPSKSTKIHFLADSISRSRQRLAVDVATGKAEPEVLSTEEMEREERIRTADLAGEYLQYLHAKGVISQSDYVPRFLATLKIRSGLGQTGDWRYDVPAPPRPDLGHESTRILLAGGIRDDVAYQEFAFRPAYHDLLDDDAGYRAGSEIAFAEAFLRYVPKAKKLHLERLDAVRINSLAPRDRFFKPTSWKAQLGAVRRTRQSGHRPLVFGINTGFGWAHRTFLGLSYVFAETELQLGGALDSNYSLGGGPSIGLTRELSSWWRIHLRGRAIFYRAGERDDHYSLYGGQGIRLTTNWNLSMETERSTAHDASVWDSKLGLRLFF